MAEDWHTIPYAQLDAAADKSIMWFAPKDHKQPCAFGMRGQQDGMPEAGGCRVGKAGRTRLQQKDATRAVFTGRKGDNYADDFDRAATLAILAG